MRLGFSSVALLVFGYCFATLASAEDYDFEIGLSYGHGNTDSTIVSTLNGVPAPSLGVTTTSSESDNVTLTGAWFYSGLSDSKGPKSRAAFLSRASSVVVGYSRSDDSGSSEFTGGSILPPSSATFDATLDEFSLDLRHVWRDSGWYALAGIATATFEGTSVVDGNSSSGDLDTSAFVLGVGKYVGDATTVDLSTAFVEAENSDATVVALTFGHIGQIGERWQFGADLFYATSDADGAGDSYGVRGALFPSSNFEFGLEYSRQEATLSLDADVVEAFAGWFVSKNAEISARYRQIYPDAFESDDIDSSEIGIGVRIRF